MHLGKLGLCMKYLFLQEMTVKSYTRPQPVGHLPPILRSKCLGMSQQERTQIRPILIMEQGKQHTWYLIIRHAIFMRSQLSDYLSVFGVLINTFLMRGYNQFSREEFMRRRSPSLFIASFTVCEMTQFRFKWRCSFVLAPVSYCLKMSYTIRR